MLPEEKLKLIREQVASKIQWGTRRAEVAQWLIEKHGITGELADEMLDAAARKRSKAIRDRAMVRLLIASVGLIFVAVFMYLRFFSGTVFYGTGAMVANICVLAVAFFSVRALLLNIPIVGSGDREGAVD